MKNNEIEVIIRGRPKAGKSTLAVFLWQTLHLHDIKSKLVDDTTPEGLSKLLRNSPILKKRKITIRTKLAPKAQPKK